ncbi:MAG: hypothetical protein ACREP4_00460 [Stenotrophomonas sp.]|uniref:hypothetical protein n=1 Tax=Stenotrophomonas sp. TaxID=69392 RepID=UPI003D6D2619
MSTALNVQQKLCPSHPATGKGKRFIRAEFSRLHARFHHAPEHRSAAFLSVTQEPSPVADTSARHGFSPPQAPAASLNQP